MFVIKELEIKNFRSHSNSKIVFDEGINLISGRNGAGKTSILEAILVALYSSRPTGMKKENLIRDGTAGYSITLKFLLDGKEYKIIRNSDGSSKLIGEVNLDGDNQINAWVERHIATSHVFTNAIYVRQGEIDAIVRDDESRERLIRKVTRIEDYENAWKNLGVIIRMFENEAKNYRQFATQEEGIKRQKELKERERENREKELKDLKARIAELEKEVAELSEKKKELDELASKLNQHKVEAERLLGELNSLKTKYESLLKSKKDVEDRISKLESDFRRYKDLEPEAKRYEELEELYRNFENELKAVEMQLAELNMEKKSLLREVENIEKCKTELEEKKIERKKLEEKISELAPLVEEWDRVKPKVDRLKALEKVLEEKGLTPEKVEELYSQLQKAQEKERKIQDAKEKLAAKKSALKTKGKQFKKALEEIKDAKGVCPTCGRELSEEHKAKIMKEYLAELKKIKEELDKLAQLEEKVESELRKIREVLSRREAVLRLKQLVDEAERLKEEVSAVDFEKLKKAGEEYLELREKHSKVSGELESLKASLSKLDELKSKLAELDKNIRAAGKRKMDLLEELRKRGFESIESIKSEMDRLKESYLEWLRLRDSERKLEEERRSLENLISEIEAVSKMLAKKEEQLKELYSKIADLEKTYSEDRHAEIGERYIEKSKELQEIKGRVKALEQSLESLERDIEYLAKELENIGEYRKKADVIEKRVLPELNKIRERYRKYKNAVAEAALKEVESYASEIFEEFTEGKYSGIKLKQVLEKKEKLKVFVVYQGEEKDISFLSGGELIALGLAFRLALAMFMVRGKLPLLILDEPTPFLDEERRRKLVDITTSYLRRIPQVIVVSHDDELKDAADRVINVDYVGGVSRVRYVEA